LTFDGTLLTTNKLAINTSGQIFNVTTYHGANSDGYNLWIGDGGQSSVGASGATYKGSYNITLGVGAGLDMTTGFGNTLVGQAAGGDILDGYDNIGIGNGALQLCTSGFENTAIGKNAGYTLTGARNCCFVGWSAGQYETGDYKLIIDAYGRASEATGRTLSLIYGVFAAAAVDQDLTINGQVGINLTPTAWLTLPAGSTTAGTAPLKLTSGTSTTVAVAGQVEFTTDDLYFTITTGAARKTVVLTDGLITGGYVPYTTTNGRLTYSGLSYSTTTTDLTLGEFPATKRINSNKIYYVDLTGSDDTGDGSSGTPWATLRHAMDWVGKHTLEPAVGITIIINDGTHTLSDIVDCDYPYGQQVTITGAHTYSKTTSSIQSSSGSAGAWSIILNLNNVTNIAVNDYVLIDPATGGSNPTYLCGCHKVTNVDTGNSRITIASAHLNTTAPSGNVVSTVTVVKTILSCLSTGFYVYTSLNIGKVVLVGPATSISPEYNGIKVWPGGRCHTLVSLGFSKFVYGVHARGGMITGEPDNYPVYISNMYSSGFVATAGGAVYCINGIASGCAYAGFLSVIGANVYAISSLATGNGTGYVATAGNALIYAVSANATGNTFDDYSPDVNTEGNSYSMVIQ
jgi:hypothetical protein